MASTDTLLKELRAAAAYDKHGKLTKLGWRVKNWKERVFAWSKNNKTLYYFETDAAFKKHEENDQLKNMLGTIDLSNAWIYLMDGVLTDQKNCFAIATPKRNFFLCAQDAKTMEAWIESIGGAGIKVKIPSMQGWLDKQGDWNSSFQRRFFRTENVGGKNVLSYYEKVTEDAKGNLELADADIAVYSPQHMQIKPKGKKRVYVLKAESDKVRDEWMVILKEIAKGTTAVEKTVSVDAALNRKTADGAAAPAADEKNSKTGADSAVALQGLSQEATYVGSCLCGKCRIHCSGKPIFAGFCHCSLCSKYGNTDRSLVCGFPKNKFQILEGKELLTGYKSSEKATRYFCSNCGTGVYSDSGGFYGCSPTLFGADDQFRLPQALLPQVHIYYGSSCLLGVIKDGGQLALYVDVPKTFGGSGETIQE